MGAPTRRHAFAVIVHTLIFRDGNVLLLRRANTGVMDGRFTLPGGHRKRGETVVDAAVRECREEVGVQARKLRPVSVLPYREGVNFIFQAVEWQGAPIIAEPDKCDALVFARPNALPLRTAPFVHTALRCHRAGIWFRETAQDEHPGRQGGEVALPSPLARQTEAE